MHKRWLEKNKQKMADAKRRWNLNNPEKCREQKRRARQRNPERVRFLSRAWAAKNKIKIKATNCNALAKRRSDREIKNIRNSDLVKIMIDANGVCSYCGQNSKPSLDHKIPLSRGGKHEIKNIAVVCLKCNSRKGEKTLKEFREYCQKNSISLII